MTFSYQPSQFLITFQIGIEQVREQPHYDDFHQKLYFSHTISLMEKYLSDVFVYEISNNRDRLIRLAQHSRFQSESLKIPYLLHHKVEDFMINSIKNLVWHRLNDVDVLYTTVLGIKFNLNGKLLNQLKLRHDIVHRNGFGIEGNQLDISNVELRECLDTVFDFILDIDKKYQKHQQAK